MSGEWPPRSWGLSFHRQIRPEVLDQEDRCHNARQLIVVQLFTHRYKADIGHGQPDIDARSVGSERVELYSPHPETATITITAAAGDREVYEFDSNGLLTRQVYDASGQPKGELQSYGDDAAAEVILVQLHEALFDLNNPVT